MKRFFVLIFFIASVLLSGAGCGISAKAQTFNEYLKSSEQVIKKMNEDIAVIEKKNATLTADQEKLKNLVLEKDKIQQAVDKINKLKTPRELVAYKDKNLQILAKGSSLLSIAEDGINKKDMKAFNDKYQENLIQEAKLKQELNTIIDRAAKDAGLEVVRQDNKVLFK